MNKGITKISTGAKFLTLLAVLLTGVAVLMTACTPQAIPVAPTVAPTATSTPNANYTPVVVVPNSIAGSIAITGMLANGNSSFSFVNTTASPIPVNTVIYFTNFSWDATLNNNAGEFVDESFVNASGPTTAEEGTISFSVTIAGGLQPYTPVVIGSSGDTSATYGQVASVNGTSTNKYIYMNHNGDGDKIFAYEGSAAVAASVPASGITFVNALIFGPDTWTTSGNPILAGNCWDSYLPWSLTYSYTATNTTAPTGAFPYFSALDLSPMFNAMGGQNSTGQNQSAFLNTCVTSSGGLNAIENGSNWIGGAAAKGAIEFGSAVAGLTACSANNAGYNYQSSGVTFTWYTY